MLLNQTTIGFQASRWAIKICWCVSSSGGSASQSRWRDICLDSHRAWSSPVRWFHTCDVGGWLWWHLEATAWCQFDDSFGSRWLRWLVKVSVESVSSINSPSNCTSWSITRVSWKIAGFWHSFGLKQPGKVDKIWRNTKPKQEVSLVAPSNGCSAGDRCSGSPTNSPNPHNTSCWWIWMAPGGRARAGACVSHVGFTVVVAPCHHQTRPGWPRRGSWTRLRWQFVNPRWHRIAIWHRLESWYPLVNIQKTMENHHV